MAGEQAQQDGAFIIRIWWEHGDDRAGTGHWRGWVQHVRNGSQAYFTSLRDMVDFIERETGMEPADERAWGLC